MCSGVSCQWFELAVIYCIKFVFTSGSTRKYCLIVATAIGSIFLPLKIEFLHLGPTERFS